MTIVEPAQKRDIPAIVDLILAQEARWHRLASLRPARSPQAVEVMLAEHLQRLEEPPLVARDASGKLRSYVAPHLRQFSVDRLSDASMLEIFPERTPFTEGFSMPSPEMEDAVPVATALLDALAQRG